MNADFFQTHELAPGLTLADLDQVLALLKDARSHPALPVDLWVVFDAEIERVSALIDGGGAGSQDPSDEAQQRPLRGSMPSPATDHSDGDESG